MTLYCYLFIRLLLSSNMVHLQTSLLRFRMRSKGTYFLICVHINYWYQCLSHVVPWPLSFILLFDTHSRPQILRLCTFRYYFRNSLSYAFVQFYTFSSRQAKAEDYTILGDLWVRILSATIYLLYICNYYILLIPALEYSVWLNQHFLFATPYIIVTIASWRLSQYSRLSVDEYLYSFLACLEYL